MALAAAGISIGLNYGTHLAASYAHTSFCLPHSVADVLQSFVTTASPVCSLLLNTMQVTQTNFATILTTTIVSTVATSLRA